MNTASLWHRVLTLVVSIGFAIGVSMTLQRSYEGLSSTVLDLERVQSVSGEGSPTVELSISRLMAVRHRVFWAMHIGWLAAALMALAFLLFDDAPRAIRVSLLVIVLVIYIANISMSPLS